MAESSDTELEYIRSGDGSDLHMPVRAHVEAALIPTTSDYPPPLDELLRLGEPGEPAAMAERIAALRLTQEHVPDLVRMARDRALNTALSETDEAWAPIHALTALAQLDASAAVADLLPLLDLDSDWFGEELSNVLASAGALAPLGDYLRDRTRWIYGRARAAEIIGDLVEAHPELRDRAVELFSAELEHGRENAPEINSFLVCELTDLDAVESLPVIRRAFEQDTLDETIMGDWGTVLEDLGQTPDPDDPLIDITRHRFEAKRAAQLSFIQPATRPRPKPTLSQLAAPKKSKEASRKHKRKMSSASRKANKSKKKRK